MHSARKIYSMLLQWMSRTRANQTSDQRTYEQASGWQVCYLRIIVLRMILYLTICSLYSCPVVAMDLSGGECGIFTFIVHWSRTVHPRKKYCNNMAAELNFFYDALLMSSIRGTSAPNNLSAPYSTECSDAFHHHNAAASRKLCTETLSSRTPHAVRPLKFQ